MRLAAFASFALIVVLGVLLFVLGDGGHHDDVASERPRLGAGGASSETAPGTDARPEAGMALPEFVPDDADEVTTADAGPFAGIDESLLLPLILRGRIVFDDGEPASDALVVHALGDAARLRVGLPTDAELGPDVPFAERLARLPHVVAGANGAFVLATRLVPDPSEWLDVGASAASDDNALTLLVRGSVLASASFFLGALASGDVDLGELVVERGASVTGRVLGAGGQPLAGVTVRDSRRRNWQAADPQGRTHNVPAGFDVATSGPDGRFRLTGLASGESTLDFVHPEQITRSVACEGLEASEARDLGDVVLARAGRVAGVVVDGEGHFVSGATVLAAASTYQGQARQVFDGGRSRALDVTSDHEGRFAVTLPIAGPVIVVAFAPGCAPTSSGEVTDGATDVRLVLVPECDLRLSVFDQDELPFVGLSLEASRWARTLEVVLSAEEAAAHVFLVRGAGEADLVVEVRGPDGERWRETVSSSEAADGLREERVVLTRGRRVSGRVLDEQGRPVAGAFVSVRPEAQSFRRHHLFDWGEPEPDLEAPGDRRTDSEGRFVTAGLPAGDYELACGAPGFLPTTRTVVLGAEQDEDLDDTTLVGAARLSGRIVRAEGMRPPSCLELVTLSGVSTGAVGPDGRFVFARVPAGHAVLSAEPGARLALELVAGEQREVEVVLRDGPRVSGRVLDADGSPVPDAKVSASLGLRVGCAGSSVSARSDAAGDFALVLTTAGTWMLRATVTSGAKSEAVELTVDCDERYVSDLVLRRGEVVTGVVVDAVSGEPLGGAAVSLAAGSCTTDEHGVFTVDRPENAQVRWRVKLDGYVDISYIVKELGDEPMRFELVRAGRIVADVRAPGGVPAISGTRVLLMTRGEDGRSRQALSASVREGRVTYPSVAPGSYELVVPRDGGRYPFDDPGAARVRMPVTVKIGEALDLVLRLD